MSLLRPARVDEDIDFSSIKSKIIRSLIGKLDCLYEDGVYYFTDIQNRFFCNFLDFGACYEYQESYEEMKYRHENSIPSEEYVSFFAPVMRVFYVPPRNRGRNLQRAFLDFVFSVAEEECEALAAFCDPFAIEGESFADTAQTAFLKFIEDGIKPTPNWLTDGIKQRDRFLKAGFRNVKYNDGKITQPWQQFLYLPATAPKEYQQTVDKLELHFKVDMERLRQLEPNG